MKQLIAQVIREEQIAEANWKAMAGGALVAASLLTGATNVDAKHQHSITQAEKQIDMEKLLHAIRHIESSDGKDTGTRYERGVERQLRKRYDILNKNTKRGIDKYGYRAMATSYGPYQLLASTCFDMGYSGSLDDLKKEEVSKEMATKYIKQLMNSSKTKKLEDVISAYNAGLGRIGTNDVYVNKVLRYYK